MRMQCLGCPLKAFSCFQDIILVRDVDGHYSMINDQDQWQVAATSTMKFSPSLVIAPARTVRILGHSSKSEEPPVARLEMVMGVPEEFLLSELWYRQNHKRNPTFADLLETLLIQPVYSHMARAERINPTLGLSPVPATDVLDVGDIHDVASRYPRSHIMPPTCSFRQPTGNLSQRRWQEREDLTPPSKRVWFDEGQITHLICAPPRI